MTRSTPAPLDLNDVQGDILVGLARKTETYVFFEIIGDVSVFRKRLAQLLPLITSSAQVSQHKHKIAEHKKHTAHGLLTLSAVNISFTHRALQKMGIKDKIGDGAFDDGMLAGAQALGDKGSTHSGRFTPDWIPAFQATRIDGLFIVSGDCHATVKHEVKKIEDLFYVGRHHSHHRAAIDVVFSIVGDVRPGKEKGHEHFGFLDGISQPAVQGVDTTPNPGQKTVAPGIILLGREKDTVKRPSWALDGSFLTFRYLAQLVPEFDTFCRAHAVPGLPEDEGAELFGARMVGRWKSGTPLDLAPLKDDASIGADARRNNDFSFGFPEDAQTQDRCPFAAHVRKSYPRDDLEKLSPPASTEIHRIIRRGIQYGPEVTAEEAREKKTLHDRGLLFVAYSSNIGNGFQFIQEQWANNVNFPPNKVTPSGASVASGFDPIIGQAPAGTARTTLGLQPKAQHRNTTLPMEWVVPRGGEYFFAPSLPALRDTFALADPEC